MGKWRVHLHYPVWSLFSLIIGSSLLKFWLQRVKVCSMLKSVTTSSVPQRRVHTTLCVLFAYTDLAEQKWRILQNNEGEQSDKVCGTAVLRHFGYPVSRKERRWRLDEKQHADAAAEYLKRNYGEFLHIWPLISQMNAHRNGVISTHGSVFINLDASVRANQRGWKERGGYVRSDSHRSRL